MAAYRRVYDSRHLQADCQEPGSAPEPYTLGNRVWATFTFFTGETSCRLKRPVAVEIIGCERCLSRRRRSETAGRLAGSSSDKQGRLARRLAYVTRRPLRAGSLDSLVI